MGSQQPLLPYLTSLHLDLCLTPEINEILHTYLPPVRRVGKLGSHAFSLLFFNIPFPGLEM